MLLDKHKFSSWVQALRLPYFITSIIPILIIFVLAHKLTGIYYWSAISLLLPCQICLHAATNLVNDLHDTLSGVDNHNSIGGSRVVLEGKITLKELRVAAFAFYALSLLFLVIFALKFDRCWVLLLWCFAFFTSYFYVAPPIRYGYRALGEIFVFMSMGPGIIAGGYAAVTNSFSWPAVFISLPMGLMSVAILFFQSLPQIESDGWHGKITLAAKLGKRTSVLITKLTWPVIWCICIFLWLFKIVNWPIWGFVFTFPFYLMLIPRLDNAIFTNNWPWLNQFGWLVQVMFFILSVFLILSVI